MTRGRTSRHGHRTLAPMEVTTYAIPIEDIDRDRFRGAETRRRTVGGDPWRDSFRTPPPIIEEIDGVERLRQVVEDDQHAVDS